MSQLSYGKMGSCALTLLAAALVVASGAAQATPFTAYIDRFYIEKDLAPFFNDDFGDGFPPPSAVGTRTYGVQGSFVGGEAGGRLRIGGDGYALSANASGEPRLTNGATLETNNEPNNTVNGLRLNSTFDVLGLFDYVTPGIGDSYGVRLTDGGLNDVVDLRVAWSSTLNAPVLRFFRQDFVLNTQTPLDEVALPTAYSGSIVLGLLHQTPNSGVITAGYCLGDFSVCDAGGGQFLTRTTTIFNGETWTRANFRAVTWVTPVPEPASLALLAVGLAGLGFSRRKQL